MKKEKRNNNHYRVWAGKKEFLPFNKAYENLRANQQRPVREQICDYLAIGQEMFYTIKNGNRPINKLQKMYIESLFKEYGIEAWTGEIIEKATAS